MLDPFCGTGTTLVECKRKKLASFGIEANPVCVLAARAKTRWMVDDVLAGKALTKILSAAKRHYTAVDNRYPHANQFLFAPEVRGLSTFSSVHNSGIMKRGWIGRRAAVMALALVHEILRIEQPSIREMLLAPLLGALVPEFGNVKYGPELYKYRVAKKSFNGFEVYRDRAEHFIDEIKKHRKLYGASRSRVIYGSAISPQTLSKLPPKIDFVITSPPYPAEHDYSRMTRLELAFGGFLAGEGYLERIKREMIPSSSKNCYVDQDFFKHVETVSAVKRLRDRVLKESRNRDHGFARVYPRLVGNYFGAMYLHLRYLSHHLRKGARCAYVLGDQSSFFSIRIRTAHLLAKIIETRRLGYKVDGIETWRVRRATTGSGTKQIPERILYLTRQ